MVKRIMTAAELRELAKQLQVRKDWHEPDEQEVTASVFGGSFDNAGFWGDEEYITWVRRYGRPRADRGIEMYVSIQQDGKVIAEVNLATLFAFACGYEG